MTKKDYQAIAGALYGARQDHANRSQWEDEVRETIGDVTARIADVLAADNPRFDRETFIAACEDGNVGRQPRTVHKRLREGLPPCVLAMKCYCAGHARGNPASEACDTREA
jgi:hypothetical protein